MPMQGKSEYAPLQLQTERSNQREYTQVRSIRLLRCEFVHNHDDLSQTDS